MSENTDTIEIEEGETYENSQGNYEHVVEAGEETVTIHCYESADLSGDHVPEDYDTAMFAKGVALGELVRVD